MRYFLGKSGLSWVPTCRAECGNRRQAAELLEIGGENQFRVRAYRRAARVIEGLQKEMRSRIWI